VEQDPFAKESYMNRVRWVWSRKVDQIQLSEEVMVHIWELAQQLNKQYDCHIKLFGPEAWKKLSRIAIACAGMLCSMDETGENLIVTKDHVNWARNFMVSCYDNKLFKLREYVDKERRLVQCDDAAIHALQGMYNSHAVLLQQLEMSTEMSQRDMQMMSGLDQKEFTKVMNQLVQYSFITFPNAKALPTQRFRMAMNQINKGVYMKKVGEN
jgi:predicted transcriptional regulator